MRGKLSIFHWDSNARYGITCIERIIGKRLLMKDKCATVLQAHATLHKEIEKWTSKVGEHQPTKCLYTLSVKWVGMHMAVVWSPFGLSFK